MKRYFNMVYSKNVYYKKVCKYKIIKELGCSSFLISKLFVKVKQNFELLHINQLVITSNDSIVINRNGFDSKLCYTAYYIHFSSMAIL